MVVVLWFVVCWMRVVLSPFLVLVMLCVIASGTIASLCMFHRCKCVNSFLEVRVSKKCTLVHLVLSNSG